MKDLKQYPQIKECKADELSGGDRAVVDLAIAATACSYAPYSHFRVGACVLLEGGETVTGCNQENAAFPAGICAERCAIFAAGARYPGKAVKTLAIAARGKDGELTDEPVAPCGTCRQVMAETEKRFSQPIHILLYGRRRIYMMDGISNLMPLTFTEF